MENYRKLIKNIGLLSISSFGSKILVFLLVPLYTNILSTYEYGSYDLVITSINLLMPILTINISSSVLRFALEKNINRNDVFSVGLKITIKGFIGLLLIIIINWILNIIPALNDYCIYFMLMYLVSALYQLCSYYARGINEIKVVAFAGIIQTILLFLFNIIFLIFFKLGISGFFIANILSLLLAIFFYCVCLKLYRINLFNVQNKNIRDEMKNYSRPLVLNSISWWVNNTSGRYIVTWICGVAANGVYSIAYKIPTILNTLQSIFLQAWEISAVQEYDPNDKNNFYGNIYHTYNICNVLVCSLVIIFTKVIAHFMFLKDFYDAWKYVPFLLIAYVFGAMAGLIGGIFSAVKDTKMCSYSTIAGALLNIILNIILVKSIGVIGAAVATLISYFVVWCIRVLNVKKYINLRIRIINDLCSYLILLLQSIAMIKFTSARLYIVEFFLFALLIFIYRNEIKKLVEIVISNINRFTRKRE